MDNSFGVSGVKCLRVFDYVVGQEFESDKTTSFMSSAS